METVGVEYFTTRKISRIRKFELEDLERIFEIEKSAFSEPNDERFELYDFYFYYKYYPNCFLVYEENRKILGYIIFTPKGHIVSIAVDPLYQKRGIGRRLISKVFEISKRIWVEVQDRNKTAKNFYKSLGFQEKKIIKNYYTSREDAIVMAVSYRINIKQYNLS